MKKNKRKKFLIFIVVIVIIVGGTLLFLRKEPKQKIEVNEVDQIDEYGYSLDDNETDYYNTLFDSLKTVLNSEEVDEEQYATLVSQLFIADFFNLDNKLSSNDIGGIQFIYEDYQDDFAQYAKDSIYHTVKNNFYNDRKQDLPVVTEVFINNIEQTNITYLDEEDSNGYIIDVKILYQEDLGYQSVASLYLVHNNNKLEIIKMTK